MAATFSRELNDQTKAECECKVQPYGWSIQTIRTFWMATLTAALAAAAASPYAEAVAAPMATAVPAFMSQCQILPSSVPK